MSGYYFDASQNECVIGSDAVLYAPWWADIMVPIALSAVAGLLALGALAYHALR
jgi:hypothetical protein